MIKSPKLNKHWSQKIHETSITSDLIIKLNLIEHIIGGSDNGEFIHFDSSLNLTEQQLISGKLYSDEIILEIDTLKISGYTLFDVQTWLKQLLTNNNKNKIILLRTVKSSYLPKQLRTYLDERFQKGSVDYDLQTIIRENVYMRTVPCTTRPPRNGEINGQDYIFLSNNEFLDLEKNGHLLEYGVYNGHYYGTPKPPKEPTTNNNANSNIKAPILNLIKRNNSINDMKHQHDQLEPLQSSSTSSLKQSSAGYYLFSIKIIRHTSYSVYLFIYFSSISLSHSLFNY
jgi:hypothetical protein